MKKFIFVLAIVVLPVIAYAATFESITVSSAAVGFSSATYRPTGGSINQCLCVLESNNIRFKYDGNDPTSSAGVLLASGSTLNLTSIDEIISFKAIRVTNDATLQCLCR